MINIVKSSIFILLACLCIINSGCDSNLFKLKVVPVITDLSAEQYEVDPGDTIQVVVTVEEQDDALQYHWTSTGGQFVPPVNQPVVQWIAPGEGGTYRLTVTVSNADGESDPSSEYINVRIQEPPKILSVECSAYTVDPGDTVDVSATLTNASDPGLDYQWTAEGGNFLPPVNQPQVQWKAPAVGGVYRITLTVARNDKVSDPYSQSITVRSFAAPYVEITTPADNSVFLQYSQIEVVVQANHQNGIFYLTPQRHCFRRIPVYLSDRRTGWNSYPSHRSGCQYNGGDWCGRGSGSRGRGCAGEMKARIKSQEARIKIKD
jgi:hypothetical protein